MDGVDVLVIGAGPTGLTMAAEATRHGLTCRIIDKAPTPSTTSRALAVQARTLEVFHTMGIADRMVALGKRMLAMNVYSEGQALGQLRLDGIPSPYPFILILEQSETERFLTERLESFGVRIEREVALTAFRELPSGVEATLTHSDGRQEQLSARWLIGCDGAHSTVRHQLGLPFRGAPYPETFILADVHIAGPLSPSEAYGFLWAGDLLVVFPMRGEGRYRLIASRPTASEQEPTLAEFQALVDARIPFEARLSDPIWLAAFRLHRRMVPQLRRGRLFLAGDAAHIHSPAGGQGMNTGIQDAYNLAWKLALVASGAAAPQLLESYQAERYPVGRHVLRATDLIFRMLLTQSPLVRRVRRLFAPFLLTRKWLQRLTRDFVAEVAINYRSSPWVAETHPTLREVLKGRRKPATVLPGLLDWLAFASGPKAGDRAPDGPLIRLDSGEAVRLFDLFRDTRHVLLCFVGARSAPSRLPELRALLDTIQERFGQHVAVYGISPGSVAGPPSPELEDPGAATHRRYGARAECLYLVRPDGYIAFRSQPADASTLLGYLARIFAD